MFHSNPEDDRQNEISEKTSRNCISDQSEDEILQAKIEDLEECRNREKNVPNSLLANKS